MPIKPSLAFFLAWPMYHLLSQNQKNQEKKRYNILHFSANPHTQYHGYSSSILLV